MIDIHSQQQTQELISDDFQFQVLDALAQNKKSIEAYQQLLKTYKSTQKELIYLNPQSCFYKNKQQISLNLNFTLSSCF